MTETTNYNYVTRSETNSTQPIIERLRYRSSVSTVVQAVDDAASLIERQQKAIDLLLRAIEPITNLSGLGATIVEGPVISKLASAKEQAERILKGEGK